LHVKKLKIKGIPNILLKMSKNARRMYDEDNVPLNIVRRNLYRKEMIKKANLQLSMETKNDNKNRTPTVRVTSIMVEHSCEDWYKKCSQYTRKNNRRFVMVGGTLIK